MTASRKRAVRLPRHVLDLVPAKCPGFLRGR